MMRVFVLAWFRRVSGVFVALAYSAFGLTDMMLSLAAFMHGVPEANPFMAWLAEHNLFVPGKVLLTAVVASIIGWHYHHKPIQALAWGALFFMVMVDIYHLWGLSII